MYCSALSEAPYLDRDISDMAPGIKPKNDPYSGHYWLPEQKLK